MPVVDLGKVVPDLVANQVAYDGTASGISQTNVQGAIDQVAANAIQYPMWIAGRATDLSGMYLYDINTAMNLSYFIGTRPNIDANNRIGGTAFICVPEWIPPAVNGQITLANGYPENGFKGMIQLSRVGTHSGSSAAVTYFYQQTAFPITQDSKGLASRPWVRTSKIANPVNLTDWTDWEKLASVKDVQEIVTQAVASSTHVKGKLKYGADTRPSMLGIQGQVYDRLLSDGDLCGCVATNSTWRWTEDSPKTIYPDIHVKPGGAGSGYIVGEKVPDVENRMPGYCIEITSVSPSGAIISGIPVQDSPTTYPNGWGAQCYLSYEGSWVEEPHNADVVGDIWYLEYFYGQYAGVSYEGGVTAMIQCLDVTDPSNPVFMFIVITDEILEHSIVDHSLNYNVVDNDTLGYDGNRYRSNKLYLKDPKNQTLDLQVSSLPDDGKPYVNFIGSSFTFPATCAFKLYVNDSLDIVVDENLNVYWQLQGGSSAYISDTQDQDFPGQYCEVTFDHPLDSAVLQCKVTDSKGVTRYIERIIGIVDAATSSEPQQWPQDAQGNYKSISQLSPGLYGAQFSDVSTKMPKEAYFGGTTAYIELQVEDRGSNRFYKLWKKTTNAQFCVYGKEDIALTPGTINWVQEHTSSMLGDIYMRDGVYLDDATEGYASGNPQTLCVKNAYINSDTGSGDWRIKAQEPVGSVNNTVNANFSGDGNCSISAQGPIRIALMVVVKNLNIKTNGFKVDLNINTGIAGIKNLTVSGGGVVVLTCSNTSGTKTIEILTIDGSRVIFSPTLTVAYNITSNLLLRNGGVLVLSNNVHTIAAVETVASYVSGTIYAGNQTTLPDNISTFDGPIHVFGKHSEPKLNTYQLKPLKADTEADALTASALPENKGRFIYVTE